MRAVRAVMLSICVFACLLQAEEAKPAQTIAQFTSAMRKIDGFIPLYWDEREGKLWLEISRWNEEFLFLDSLPAGIGSNDIGLDRGQVGHSRVVKFLRVGPKVLLEEVNYGFRASGSELERRSVQDACPTGVTVRSSSRRCAPRACSRGRRSRSSGRD